jgi:hypothetical protein
LVAEMPDNDATHAAGEESYRVGRQCRHRPRQRIESGKEQLAEHQGRCRSVEKEIVPLDRRADEADYNDSRDGRGGQFGRCHAHVS